MAEMADSLLCGVLFLPQLKRTHTHCLRSTFWIFCVSNSTILMLENKTNNSVSFLTENENPSSELTWKIQEEELKSTGSHCL